MPSKTAKAEMLENLRVMLRDVFRLRSEGVPYARLARAHGYVDGYMRALLETSITDKQELLGLVAEERQSAHGPATAAVGAHEPDTGAAAIVAA
jgi:hypothetical protein